MHTSNFPDLLDSVGEAKLLGNMLEVMICWEGKKIDWAHLRPITWCLKMESW
jgi:hypothetical protein